MNAFASSVFKDLTRDDADCSEPIATSMSFQRGAPRKSPSMLRAATAVMALGLVASALTSLTPAFAQTTLIVTSDLDYGGAAATGTLRQVLQYQAINCYSPFSPFIINFNIPGGGPHTIQPGTALPTIECSGTKINGYSQPGASVNTSAVNVNSETASGNDANLKIILNGSIAGSSSGLTISGNNVEVRGLAIRSFAQQGIYITGDLATIRGNYIGTDPGGMTGYANGVGILVANGASTLIGGGGAAGVNLITGNTTAGVQVISPTVGVSILGNMLGGDRSGGGSISSGGVGVIFSAPTCGALVNMASSAYGNRIRYHAGSGVLIDGCASNVDLQENAISANVAKAININGGGNGALQKPTITTVSHSIAGTSITGSFTPVITGGYSIDLYGNPTNPTVSEAQFFVPNTNTTANAIDTSPGKPFTITNSAIVRNPAVAIYRNTVGSSELSDVYRSPFSFAPGFGGTGLYSPLPNLTTFNVTAGAAAQFQTVVLTNTSGTSLTFGATPVTVTGTNFTLGTPANPCAGATVLNGASCNIQIGFSSATSGSSSETFTVSVLQNGITSSAQGALSGNASPAVAPAFTVTGSGIFPNTYVLGRSNVQSVTVTNTGTANLVISSIALSNPSEFGDSYYGDTRASAAAGYAWCKLGSDSSGAPASGSKTLAPGDSCTFDLYFKPTSTGLRSGTITFVTNASPSIQTIELSGGGIAGVAPTAPGTPTVTAYNGYALVSFTPSTSPNGVVRYTVVSNPAGGFDSNGGSSDNAHIVTGLTNGTAYTFTVQADNGAGTSTSPASTSATPATPSLTLPKPVAQANLLAYYALSGSTANLMGGSAYNLGAGSLSGGSMTLSGSGNSGNNSPSIEGVGYKSFSFSVDFNMDAAFTDGPVLVLGSGFRTVEFGINSGLHPRIGLNNGGFSYLGGPANAVFTGTTLATGVWYRATVTVDVGTASPTVKLYIDGALVGTVTTPTLSPGFLFDVSYTTSNPSDRFFLFANPGDGSSFRGLANNLLVYGSALAAPEVTALHTALGAMGGLLNPTVSSAMLNFPATAVDTASIGQNLTITNPNATPLELSFYVTANGASQPEFPLGLFSCSLAPGSSCFLQVKFAPTIADEFPSTLNINSAAGTVQVDLAGMSYDYDMSDSGPVTFPVTAVTAQSGTQTVTFTNNSLGAANIDSVSLVGDDAADFIKTGGTCDAGVLAAGSSCTVIVKFAPLTPGFSKTATIRLQHANTTYENVVLSGSTLAGPFAYISNYAFGNIPNETPPHSSIDLKTLGDASVSVIDLSTNAAVGSVSVHAGPYGVAVNQAGTRVYVTHVDSNRISVINTAVNTVMATVTVGSSPKGVAVTPDGSRVFVANSGSNTVSVISAATNVVTNTISVGSSPNGVTVSPNGAFAYVGNYVGNSISVIDTSTLAVVATISGVTTPSEIVFNANGTRAYVPLFTLGEVAVIDVTNHTLITAIPGVGASPNGAVLVPGNKLFVTTSGGNNVRIIDTLTNTLGFEPVLGGSQILVGGTPIGIKTNSSGSHAYVVNSTGDSVSVINTSTFAVSTIGVGANPIAFGQFIAPAATSLVAPTITSGIPSSGTVGANYSYTGSATGTGPITWSVTSGSLPPGLSLNSTTGVLSGTPTTTGSYTFTVQAANGVSPNATATWTIAVGSGLSASPSSVNFGNVASGSSSAVTTVTITKSAGVGCLDFNAPTFSGPDASSFAVVVVSNSCTGAKYGSTCNVGVQFNASGPSSSKSASLTISGAEAGCNASVAPSLDDTPKSTNVRTKAGGPTVAVTVLLSGAVGSGGGSAPVIGAIPAMAIYADDPFSFTPSVTSATPVTWSLSGNLPPGLVFTASTGNISGTPIAAGNFSLTLTATNSSGVTTAGVSIAVSIRIIPQISLSTNSLDFGNQDVGTTSASQTIQVSNSGNGPLVIRGVDGIGDFPFTSTCSGSLAPGASCTVTVSFAPLTDGALSGRISINTNAQRGDGGISLSGVGVKVPTPNLVITPASLTFTERAQGTISPVQTVFLSNTGTADLNLSNLKLNGTSFSFGTPLDVDNPRGHLDCGTSISIGKSCAVGVAFRPLKDPAALGPLTGSVSFTHDATPTRVPVQAEIGLSGRATQVLEPLISVAGGAAFGDQLLNSPSAPQTITVTNTGTADLTVSGVSVVTNNPTTNEGDFRVANGCSILQPNARCTITITFSPTGVAGARSATLNIANNAANGANTRVGLSGNALALPVPIMTLSATTVSFGTVNFGSTPPPQAITVSNTGTANLNIGGISVKDTDTDTVSFSQSSTGCGVLAPNTSCTISVSFTATGAVGAKSGTLTIPSNVVGGPSTVTLNGAVSGPGCRFPAQQRSPFFVGTPCGNGP